MSEALPLFAPYLHPDLRKRIWRFLGLCLRHDEAVLLVRRGDVQTHLLPIGYASPKVSHWQNFTEQWIKCTVYWNETLVF